ncbi:MAG: hypothetical protein LBV65_04555 [Desulfovibrio sp.]|jgi:hypothetical protein|nr:hypothetical protein [Desulfovibrio sp.]
MDTAMIDAMLEHMRAVQSIQGERAASLRTIPVAGYREIAAPLGIVAAIIPTTNPTSTTPLCFRRTRALRTAQKPQPIIAEAAKAAGAAGQSCQLH